MESNIIVEDIILELLKRIVLDTPPKLIIEPDSCSGNLYNALEISICFRF